MSFQHAHAKPETLNPRWLEEHFAHAHGVILSYRIASDIIVQCAVLYITLLYSIA